MLFSKRDRGFELGTTEKQISLVVRADALNPGLPKPLGHAASTSVKLTDICLSPQSLDASGNKTWKRGTPR